MAGEPMEPRAELDLPQLIVSKFGHLEFASGKNLEQMLAAFFEVGDTVSLHLVAECTGIRRQFCKFIVEPAGGGYKHECSKLLSLDYICPDADNHNKQEELHHLKVAEEASEE